MKKMNINFPYEYYFNSNNIMGEFYMKNILFKLLVFGTSLSFVVLMILTFYFVSILKGF